MNIDNRSSVPIDKIRPILEFVAKKIAVSNRVWWRIHDGDPEQHFGGMALSISPLMQGALGQPFLIDIWLGPDRQDRYPYTDKFIPPCSTEESWDVPAVTVDNWSEEFVLVASHEARHIHQLNSPVWDPATEEEMEKDAERMAQRVLRSWVRAQKTKVVVENIREVG